VVFKEKIKFFGGKTMRIQLKALSLITEWISFLWMALPAKLRPTFLELLTGAMVSQSGHVTKALLSIRPIRTWTTYFKAIEKGQFYWMKLAKQWLALLMSQLGNKELIVAIDDFITPRSSLKAPSVALHHDHAKRMNRPRYLWGQIRVSLAMVGNCGNRHTAFPLLMHLIRKGGNRTKLHSALLLMRVLMKWVPTKTRVKLLLDCWYMKAPFLLPIIDQVECIIGQVRKDSALYSLPTRQVEKKPGRPRKYGRRLYFETIQCEYLQQETKLQAYGKKRLFQFYSFKAKVRFLKGHLCRIVWCRFQQDSGKWTKWHLLICTMPQVPATEIIRLYALRWWTEPMFNELKNLFGLQEAWQQTRQALARWTMFLSLAYSLPKLLALILGPVEGAKNFPIPWRKDKPMTAGWMATAMRQHFRGLSIAHLWDRKSQKMHMPEANMIPIFASTG
jgi:hypothetical protein